MSFWKLAKNKFELFWIFETCKKWNSRYLSFCMLAKYPIHVFWVFWSLHFYCKYNQLVRSIEFMLPLLPYRNFRHSACRMSQSCLKLWKLNKKIKFLKKWLHSRSPYFLLRIPYLDCNMQLRITILNASPGFCSNLTLDWSKH